MLDGGSSTAGEVVRSYDLTDARRPADPDSPSGGRRTLLSPRSKKLYAKKFATYLSQTSEQKSVRASAASFPTRATCTPATWLALCLLAFEIPELCLVLCPNHTGVGRALAIVSEGAWETPLGNVPIDSAFAAALKQRCSALQEDSSAHRSEHAAEVELPFLQDAPTSAEVRSHRAGHGQFEVLEELGNAIADVIAAQDSSSPDRRLERHESLRI